MAAGERLLGERFELHEELGRGGMGVVWRATDNLLGRQVAVKQLTAGGGGTLRLETAAQDQLLREARAAAKLSHPGAVTIHDVVRHEDGIVIVMELIQAPTLARLIADGPLTSKRAAALGAQLAEVLETAHTVGIIHRDVKPDNVMVLEGDRVKLADFGIARLADEVSGTMSVLGTPAYMSPEQLRGSPLPATDLWALGATLFCAVEGVGPFARPAAMESVAAVLTDAPLAARRAEPALAALIGELLNKEPERRPDAAAVRRRLQEIAEGRTTEPAGPGTSQTRTSPTAPTTALAELPVPAATRVLSVTPPDAPSSAGSAEPSTSPPRQQRSVLAALVGIGAVALWVLSWFRLEAHTALTAPGVLLYATRPFVTWQIDAFHAADGTVGNGAAVAPVAAGFPFEDGALTVLLVLTHLPFLALLFASFLMLSSDRHARWAGLLTGSAVMWGSAGLAVAHAHDSGLNPVEPAWLDSTPYLLAALAGVLAVLPVLRPGLMTVTRQRGYLVGGGVVAVVGTVCVGLAAPGGAARVVAVVGSLATLLAAGVQQRHAFAAALAGGWALGVAAPLTLGIAVALQEPDTYARLGSVPKTMSAVDLVLLVTAVVTAAVAAIVRASRTPRETALPG
ncbi:serine/threonine-protein kinase [Streptomyces iakyrus]|uniref:serine/threonine-protein kinase n=1 Tax=Streptomyces iakyrus TaxID=68219 RepID=UPI0036E6217C